MLLLSLFSLSLLTTVLASEASVPNSVAGDEKIPKADEKSQYLVKLLGAIGSFQIDVIEEVIAEYPAFKEKYEDRIMDGFWDFCAKSSYNSPSNQIALFKALEPCFVDPSDSVALISAFRHEPRENNVVVDFLLDSKDLNINQHNGYNETPLMLACMYGNAPTVRKILARNPDRNIKTTYNENALNFALYNRNLESLREVVKILIDEPGMKLSKDDLPYKLPIGANSLAERIRALGGTVNFDYSALVFKASGLLFTSLMTAAIFQWLAPYLFAIWMSSPVQVIEHLGFCLQRLLFPGYDLSINLTFDHKDGNIYDFSISVGTLLLIYLVLRKYARF